MLKASLFSHLETLSNKHEELEQSIHEAYNSFADDSLVKSLKKQKLLLKQQMVAVEQKLQRLQAAEGRSIKEAA